MYIEDRLYSVKSLLGHAWPYIFCWSRRGCYCNLTVFLTLGKGQSFKLSQIFNTFHVAYYPWDRYLKSQKRLEIRPFSTAKPLSYKHCKRTQQTNAWLMGCSQGKKEHLQICAHGSWCNKLQTCKPLMKSICNCRSTLNPLKFFILLFTL